MQAKSSKTTIKKSIVSYQTKMTLVVLACAIAVIGGGIWAYFKFTTVPPPDLQAAQSDEVVDFLGNSNGFARMSIPQRQDFLIHTYQRYSNPVDRDRFVSQTYQMSDGQRRVFLDATFDIVKKHLMEQTREYSKIRSKQQREQFINNAINNMEAMRQELGGSGPNMDLGAAFKNDMPKSHDEWVKMGVSRTNAKERAEIVPFLDTMAARMEERRGQSR